MLRCDLHVHSVHSGHAYGTLYDILREASRKELTAIAITDHGPAMPGVTGSPLHFRLGRRAPKFINGVRLLWGCEANVVDESGALDLAPDVQNTLDVLLANFHEGCGYGDAGLLLNTRAMQRAMCNPNLKILSHPTSPAIAYDYRAVIETALENGVLLEINLAYLARAEHSSEIDGFQLIVEMARGAGEGVVVNSDAHFLHEVGDDSILDRVADRIGLTRDMILNDDPEALLSRLGIDTGMQP